MTRPRVRLTVQEVAMDKRMEQPEDGTRFETNAIRTQADRSGYREHSVPVYLTSSYLFDSAEHGKALFLGQEEGLVYSRYGNPNTDEFVAKLCRMEGAEDGLATATGMAAVFASIAGLLKSGDHVVCSRASFGSTLQILKVIMPRFGVETTFVDPADVDAWRGAVRTNTRMLVAETPSNPGLELVDIAALADIAHAGRITLNIDNCFATPYLQRPLELGADIVTHSATKFMDGQGRVLGGAILGRKALVDWLQFFTRQTGPSLSPFNAWVLSKSLETLAVRMERHCDNAEQLAEALRGHTKLGWVRYPFADTHPQRELARRQMRRGGGLVTFEVAGGETGGMAFINALEMISRSSNLGDARTIATHPATTTHSSLPEEERLAMGITPGTIRISVGLEHADDIIGDVLQALDRA
jgi:O-succinylhomoserine sulfhydrylase